MLGIMMTEQELQEIEYLLKRELDDLLYDLNDQQLKGIVRRVMEERYHILFGLFTKVSSPSMSLRYIREKRYK